MANYVYSFVALTGGAGGALDAIAGPGLADKDMAYGSVGGHTYTYILDADLNVAESSPLYIVPDTTPGTKVWVLQSPYYYVGALADTGTITLPTITANYPARGNILCAHASTGVISESAEFEFGSTGEVQIIRGTANIEAGGATAGKISLGPVADANPVVIKNNLGGGVSVNVIITLDWK